MIKRVNLILEGRENKENKEINEHLKTFPHLILDMNISAGVIAS